MAFTLTMYPALNGDCLLLSWGEPEPSHHILVDLGWGATYAVARPDLVALANLDLFVMTHIDADHIAGAMPLVAGSKPPFIPSRLWYNGYHQLVAASDRKPIHEPFSARQGEKLSRGIVKFDWPWNREFASEIVSIDSPEAKKPFELPGGLSIILLSPRDQNLIALEDVWKDELKNARLRLTDRGEEPPEVEEHYEALGAIDVKKLAKADYHPDRTEANGSSIAFIAEFAGKRVLLAADAHSEVLEGALRPLAETEGGRYRLDLVKLSHHGSRNNTSPEFPKLIDCTRFAISTDGSRRPKHPHAETIARLLATDPERDKTFYFNYRQPQSECWDSERLTKRWKYECVFPVAEESCAGNGRLCVPI
jgi:beta-lactamase superfamily II metal-dependent hydrolase